MDIKTQDGDRNDQQGWIRGYVMIFGGDQVKALVKGTNLGSIGAVNIYVFDFSLWMLYLP